MTPEELSKLTPAGKRNCIALALGWERTAMNGLSYAGKDENDGMVPPDYLSDLNAMAHAEEVIFRRYGEDLANRYTSILRSVVCPDYWRDFKTHHATAAQRADAFLLAVG